VYSQAIERFRQFESARVDRDGESAPARQLVVAASANASDKDQDSLARYGMFDAVMAKPISVKDIQQCMAKYMDGTLPLRA
jgi:CheY-like chemotaxis protein